MNRFEVFCFLRHAMRHLAMGHCGKSDAPEVFLALATLSEACVNI